MKFKLLPLMLIPTLFLSGCNNGNSIDNKAYSKDLEKLVSNISNGSWLSFSDVTNYIISAPSESKTTDNNYLYTVKISYKTQTINNFRVILLPEENISTYNSSNLPCFGYYSVKNLTPTHPNGDTTNYPEYKLQIEKQNKQNYAYLLVSYNGTDDYIKLNF